jgi:hypothetical protein
MSEERAKARLFEAVIFRMAVEDAAMENPTDLAALIRSDLRFGLFSSFEREALAKLVEGSHKRGPGRPRLQPENPKTELDRIKRTLIECVDDVRRARIICKEEGLSYRKRGDKLIQLTLDWRVKKNKPVATLEQVRSALKG